MTTPNLKSIKGFQTAMGTLSIFFLIIILHVIRQFVSIDLGAFYRFLLIVIIVLCISGCTDSYRGLRDPYSTRKIAGLFLNTAYLILIVSMLVANVMDLARAFS